MELITFILCAYGLTQIVVYGKIFNKIRPTKGRAGELFRCPMCMGFHVGWFLFPKVISSCLPCSLPHWPGSGWHWSPR